MTEPSCYWGENAEVRKKHRDPSHTGLPLWLNLQDIRASCSCGPPSPSTHACNHIQWINSLQTLFISEYEYETLSVSDGHRPPTVWYEQRKHQTEKHMLEITLLEIICNFLNSGYTVSVFQGKWITGKFVRKTNKHGSTFVTLSVPHLWERSWPELCHSSSSLCLW